VLLDLEQATEGMRSFALCPLDRMAGRKPSRHDQWQTSYLASSVAFKAGGLECRPEASRIVDNQGEEGSNRARK